MTERGIEILRQEERLLSEDEVRTLYSHLQDEVIWQENKKKNLYDKTSNSSNT